MLVNDWFVVKASTTAWPRTKNNGRRWDNTEALATQSCLLLSQNADAIPLGTLMCTLYLKAEKTLSVIYLTPSYTILHHLTPSYTILHHLTPPQAKDAKVSPTTSPDFNSLGRAPRLAHEGSALRPWISELETHDLTRGQSLAMTCNDDTNLWLEIGLPMDPQNIAKSCKICFCLLSLIVLIYWWPSVARNALNQVPGLAKGFCCFFATLEGVEP